MDALLLIGLLLLNVLISIWNCYAVGSTWKDTMAAGSGFDKLLLWSGAIQSGVGFSMPILVGLTVTAVPFLTSGAEPTLSPEEGKAMMKAIFSLWYLAVIFPILGTGLAIWAHSIRMAYKERSIGSFAVAGWNTFAQVSNTLDALENVGPAFGTVGEFFGDALKGNGDAKGKAAILAILIVVIALVGGFMIAFALIRMFARRAESAIGYKDRNRHAHA